MLVYRGYLTRDARSDHFYRERIAESTVTNLKMARITLLLALADYCFYFCVLI